MGPLYRHHHHPPSAKSAGTAWTRPAARCTARPIEPIAWRGYTRPSLRGVGCGCGASQPAPPTDAVPRPHTVPSGGREKAKGGRTHAVMTEAHSPLERVTLWHSPSVCSACTTRSLLSRGTVHRTNRMPDVDAPRRHSKPWASRHPPATCHRRWLSVRMQGEGGQPRDLSQPEDAQTWSQVRTATTLSSARAASVAVAPPRGCPQRTSRAFNPRCPSAGGRADRTTARAGTRVTTITTRLGDEQDGAHSSSSTAEGSLMM